MGKCFICNLEVHSDIHSCRFCPLLHFLCNKVSYRGWNANLSDMEDFLSCYVTSCLPDFGSWSLLDCRLISPSLSHHTLSLCRLNSAVESPAYMLSNTIKSAYQGDKLISSNCVHGQGITLGGSFFDSIHSWSMYVHTYKQPERVVVCRC